MKKNWIDYRDVLEVAEPPGASGHTEKAADRVSV
jgi:hypothetical protein